MKMKLTAVVLTAMMVMINSSALCSSLVSTFEEVPLSANSHMGGTGVDADGFESGSAYYDYGLNSYGFWHGFAYSNMTDMTTGNYLNDFSAYIDGAENNASGNQYCVCYTDMYAGGIPSISLTGELYDSTLDGMWITNTTYAYLTMLNGDGWSAKPFGGADGNDQDYFNLAIKGITESGENQQIIDFKLADFTFADNSLDYIISEWTWVDLSSLGDIIGVEFILTSSDNHPEYGMNTPAYFAFDNFNSSQFDVPAVPEPASILLMISGAAISLRRTKK